MDSPAQQSGDDSVPPHVFRLLALPAELRMRIYEHALTAPSNAIRIYYSFQRNRVNPGLALALLRTCRQVYSEARDVLYQENTVLVHADVMALVAGSLQLPPLALRSLRRAFVVLDASDSFPFNYEQVDFRPFQAMVRLRQLRVAVVTQPGWVEGTDSWTDLLSYVVERVPGSCKLEFGAQTDEEKNFTRRFCYTYRGTMGIAEVPRDMLLRAAGYCQAVQGCKSGSGIDWRDPRRSNPNTIEEVRTW